VRLDLMAEATQRIRTAATTSRQRRASSRERSSPLSARNTSTCSMKTGGSGIARRRRAFRRARAFFRPSIASQGNHGCGGCGRCSTNGWLPTTL